MPKFLLSLLFLFSIHKGAISQNTITPDELALKIPQASTYSVDGIVNYIKQNFVTDTSRARAIYTWITHNINYDIAQVQPDALKEKGPPQSTVDVLKTRAAVCQGYANVFVELCTGVGIKAQFVGGYGKIQGKLTPLPHAWIAAELQGNWYLFDPTWGAGFVQNDHFVRAANNTFYKVSPAVMIKDHMPFDPLFQFLNYIITNKEFIDGQTAINTAKPLFNYIDTLKQYASLSSAEKMEAEARRMEAIGLPIKILWDRYAYLKKGKEFYSGNDKFQESVVAFNKAIALLNEYIGHRNKQFTTVEDNKLRHLMDSISYHANQARTLLFDITPANAADRQNLAGNRQNIEKLQTRLVEESDFVARYLNTEKTARLELFRK